MQTNVEQLPVEMNPFGNGFRAVETELQREQQAKRCTDPHAGRTWKIKNPQRINSITGGPAPTAACQCCVYMPCVSCCGA